MTPEEPRIVKTGAQPVNIAIQVANATARFAETARVKATKSVTHPGGEALPAVRTKSVIVTANAKSPSAITTFWRKARSVILRASRPSAARAKSAIRVVNVRWSRGRAAEMETSIPENSAILRAFLVLRVRFVIHFVNVR